VVRLENDPVVVSAAAFVVAELAFDVLLKNIFN